MKFSIDAIDDTEIVEDVLKPRVESIGGQIKKVILSGTHLTPCIQVKFAISSSQIVWCFRCRQRVIQTHLYFCSTKCVIVRGNSPPILMHIQEKITTNSKQIFTVIRDQLATWHSQNNFIVAKTTYLFVLIVIIISLCIICVHVSGTNQNNTTGCEMAGWFRIHSSRCSSPGFEIIGSQWN